MGKWVTWVSRLPALMVHLKRWVTWVCKWCIEWNESKTTNVKNTQLVQAAFLGIWWQETPRSLVSVSQWQQWWDSTQFALCGVSLSLPLKELRFIVSGKCWQFLFQNTGTKIVLILSKHVSVRSWSDFSKRSIFIPFESVNIWYNFILDVLEIQIVPLSFVPG